MGRNRKTKTPFKDFERATNRDGYEVDYIRVLDLQLCCMHELSSSAFRLYINMKNHAKGNVEFEYPHSEYGRFLSNQTFKTARDELIKKGYLEPFISNKNLRVANKYRFSSGWRTRNQDLIREEIQRRVSKKEHPKSP